MSMFCVCLGCGCENRLENTVSGICHTCFEVGNYNVCLSCGDPIPASDTYCLYCEGTEADI